MGSARERLLDLSSIVVHVTTSDPFFAGTFFE